MPHVRTLEELIPPWVADEAWQQTSDSIFRSLAMDGGLTLRLQGGGLHQAAMQAAYACSKDLQNHPALGAQAPRTPGASLGEGWMGQGYQQEFSYQSGPWQAGDLSSQQHSTLQKAMAAGQEICMLVLTCLAASRGVRLSPAALQRLVEMPPFDPRHWSASVLHAFFPAGLAASLASDTPAAADPLPDGCYEHGIHPGLLTLVYAPGLAGLELIDAYEEWQAVEPLCEDQVLIVPGHTLERALCGLLPPAEFRVVTLEGGGPQRHCLASELRPAPGALIDFIRELDEAGHAVLARRYPPVTGADLLAHIRRSLDGGTAASSGPPPVLPLVPLPATAPARLETPLEAGAQASAQAEGKPAEDAGSQQPFSVRAAGSSASEHDRVAAYGAPGLASSEASGGATHKGQRGTKKKLEKVPSSAAVPQVDGPGTAGGAGVPGKEHTSAVPSGSQEAVLADEMLELTIKTLTGRVDRLTVSRFATVASILLAYQEKEGTPPDQWRLIFADRQLEKDRTAADYGITSGDVLTAVLKLRGD